MWYYANNNERRGPVDQATFDELVRTGEVGPETLVWREGMAEWTPWRVVAGAGGGVVATGSTVVGRPLDLEFSGTAGEYFRVWIVNVLLTVVTFGIYAAWAKVRTKRYFYAHTSLAGHAFEYLAEPKRILIGNLIVGALFLAFNASAAISPVLLLPMYIVLFAAVPWILAKSILFNARNSAWRGLRFGFTGSYGGAFKVFVLWPLLMAPTLGFIWPYVAKRQREWITNHYRYGTSGFAFGGETGEFYRIYLKALGFFVPLVIAYFLVIGAAFGAAMQARNGGPAQPPSALMMAAPFVFLAGFVLAFVGAQYVRARLFVYKWNSTTLGAHGFAASMRARDLIGIQLVNFIVTVLTLGLAWPWAAVRMARFQLSCLSVVPGGDLDAFVGESQPEPGALSEAAGDFLDFDIGFGV